MLNRRFLRIKVLQGLYGFFSRHDTDVRRGEKEMLKSIDRLYDLYFYMLDLLLVLQAFAERKIEDGLQKRLPTEADLNPNRRFVDNRIFKVLRENNDFYYNIEDRTLGWKDHGELIRGIYREMIESPTYAQYMSRERDDFDSDREFMVWLYSEVIAPMESIHDILEDHSIYWPDDMALVNSTVLKTLRTAESAETLAPEPLFKDPEDRDFAIELFRKTIFHTEEFTERIAKRAVNWESERIAQMDLTLMQMAICEFMFFPTIPLKVSMNEYIELSKEYSTERSKTFINGILDKLLGELQSEGKVKKIGRGLIG